VEDFKIGECQRGGRGRGTVKEREGTDKQAHRARKRIMCPVELVEIELDLSQTLSRA